MSLSPGQIVAAVAPIVGKAGAAGVAGNAMQESTDRSNAGGGNLLQWQGARQAGLQAYARAHGLDPNSDQANLGYLVQDLKGPYAGLAAQLRKTSDPGHAAVLFSNIYERPGTPMLSNRIKYAQQAAGAPITGTFPTLKQGRPTTMSIPGTKSTTLDTNAIAQNVFAHLAAQPITDHLAGENGLNDFVKDEQSGNFNVTTSTPTTKVTIPGAPAAQATAAAKLPSDPGITNFGGKQVAKWIAPILAYAKAHGWTGGVNSGYRTYSQQLAIYNSGVRPAAKPGTSTHEMTAFPGGAVDVSQAQQLSDILAHSPYAGKLVWAGSKDPVHFSHPHGGSY